MFLNCGVGEDSWESLGLQGDTASSSYRRSVLGVHWRDWCWNWNSNTLATWYEGLIHLKRPWCWERLRTGGEGDYRGWDDCMAILTRWTWVWVNSKSWWWTGRPGVLWFMGWQRVRHDWATELKWNEKNKKTKKQKTKDYFTHGHHQGVNTEIRVSINSAAEYTELLCNQQLTLAQIMSSYCKIQTEVVESRKNQ